MLVSDPFAIGFDLVSRANPRSLPRSMIFCACRVATKASFQTRLSPSPMAKVMPCRPARCGCVRDRRRGTRCRMCSWPPQQIRPWQEGQNHRDQ